MPKPPIASKFLGFLLTHIRSSRTFSVSYPGYVSTLLTRLRPSGIAHTFSPSIYIPPSYGSTIPQSPTTFDDSPPASPSQAIVQQVAIGYLLYYGRAVDALVLPATCALASEQASPNFPRVLLDASSPDPVPEASPVAITFSETKTTTPPSTFLSQHTLHVYLSFVPSLPRRNTALFSPPAASRHMRDKSSRQIFCDNEVAIGLANDSINFKMSISLDMRFHWLRDRVKQHQFRIIFVPGAINIADFFTKALRCP
jgi:hypothetical protein